MEDYKILNTAAKHALDYLDELPERRVFPDKESLERLEGLTIPLPDSAVSAGEVIETLHEIGSVNTVARMAVVIWFCIWWSIPASLAASWLVSAWDRMPAFKISSPITAHIEKMRRTGYRSSSPAIRSLALGLLRNTHGKLLCGSCSPHHYASDWAVYKSKGMNGAPKIRVMPEKKYMQVCKEALLLAGFGLENIIKSSGRRPGKDHSR